VIQQIRAYRPNWGTIVSILLICLCVTYLNQREVLKGLLGNWTVLFDFVAGAAMLANSQLKEIFSKTAVEEVTIEEVKTEEAGTPDGRV